MKTEIHVYGADSSMIETQLRTIRDLPPNGLTVYGTDFGALVYIDAELTQEIIGQMHEVLRANVFREAFPELPLPEFPKDEKVSEENPDVPAEPIEPPVGEIR